jgi:hypothetical protein
MFDQFCADGECLNAVDAIDNPEVNVDTIRGSPLKDIAATALEDLGNSSDADTSTAEYLLNDASNEELAEVARGVIEENFGESWLAELLGSFVDGDENSGMERKGKRVEP